ncbi:MAG: hypothetical protein IJF61_02980 [Clostridia bacterium]|nr:hypothetical protein [Clostridia bacterium]
MKRKVAVLVLICMMFLSNGVFAANVSISADGIYIKDGAVTLTQGPIPFLDGETLYLPAAAVLQAAGIPAEASGKEVTAMGITLTADSPVITKNGVSYSAKRAPVLVNGVVYADSDMFQTLYGITAEKPSEDGTVKLSMAQKAAQVTISKEGAYTKDGVTTQGKAPYTENTITYLPVAEVLSALNLEVEQVYHKVITPTTEITANSVYLLIGSSEYAAKRPPILRENTVYADIALMQQLYGITITEDKDKNITVTYGNVGSGLSDEGLQTDDSWYYELVPVEESNEGLTNVEIIKNNVTRSLYNATGNPYVYINKMRPDGAFTDIDYDLDTGAIFPPVNHLYNLENMCKMVYCPENPYYLDPVAIDAIARGVEYFIKHKFTSTNWWWNVVGVPQAWQSIVLYQPQGLEKYWDQIMVYCQGVEWGGNGGSSMPFVLNEPEAKNEHTIRTYTGSGPGPGERIYASIKEMFYVERTPEEEERILQDCITGISMEMAFLSTRVFYNKADVEGDTLSVQIDYSYHDHANSFLPLAYGQQYVNTISATMQRFRGTSYRISDEAIINMQNGLLDGWAWYYYNGLEDAHYVQNGMGRGTTGDRYNTPTSDYRFTVSAKKYVNYLIDAMLKEYGDVLTRKSELQELGNRIANPSEDNFEGNRYFWVSDYFSHHRKDWNFSVLVPSSRMQEQETFAGSTGMEGLLYRNGPHNLLTVGDDNSNPAARDWNRLPGTTWEMNYYTLNKGKAKAVAQSDMAGGTSDGMYGMAMVDFLGGYVDGAKLKRSWFCFDDEVVCLGAGISGNSTDIVSTTIDQVKTKGTVKAGNGNSGKDITAAGEAEHFDTTGSTWVLNGDTGYVIEPSAKTYVENGIRSGDLARHDSATPANTIVEGNIFFLGIDHGISPENASYQYTILPVTTEEELMAYSQSPKAVILSNTAEVQAVYHKDLKILQAAFYKAGSIETPDGLKLTVTQPGAVMVRLYDDGTYSIHAADVQQRTVRNTITLAGTISASHIFEFTEGEKGWVAGKTMHYYSNEGFKDVNTYNPNLGENTEFDVAADLLAVCINGELMRDFNPYHHYYELQEPFSEVPEIKAKGNFETRVLMGENEAVIKVTDPQNPDNEAIYTIRFQIKDSQTNE